MNNTFTENTAGGFIYMTAPVITAKHAFTTRAGGVSSGAFSSLNLSYGRGDKAENVTENYRRLGEALGIDTFSAAFTKQVHGSTVRLCTDKERAKPTDPTPYQADGLVTNVPGLPLLAFTADCVPVLLHDPAAKVAAAVHCGWRSSVADILGVAIGKMAELGSRPSDIRAAIGPAIGRCCFETGPEVPEAIRSWLGEEAGNFCEPEAGVPGKYMVDLRAANRKRLLQLGVLPENIAVSDECTMCMPGKYWSHRAAKGGGRGSQCAVICL
ncbi:MAG: peptidoglycan editing factor PgeF [Clostridia bacterium]|nr:peptidoglycan editing factor PgeF [Clostridia bacterium]